MKNTARPSRHPKTFALMTGFALAFGVGIPEAYAIDADACGALMGTYSIVPYTNWGSAPPAIQRTWNDSDCNHQICFYMQRRFNVIPHLSWGSLPVHLQGVWNHPQVNCNAQVENPPPRR